MTLREKARAVFDAALRASDVGLLVLQALAGLDLPARGRLLVVGAGKASGAMAAAGHVFYCSANGVWLTDHVPPAYITFPEDA